MTNTEGKEKASASMLRGEGGEVKRAFGSSLIWMNTRKRSLNLLASKKTERRKIQWERKI